MTSTLLLCCCLMSMVGQPAFAPGTGSEVCPTFTDKFDVVLGDKSFEEVFGAETPFGEEDLQEGVYVDYDYSISPIFEEGRAEAVVHFTLSIHGKDYPVTVTGKVEKIMVEDGDVNHELYRGALWGNATIHNKNYTVSLGLDKLSTQTDINAGVVFSPEDLATNENAELIFLRFGTPIPPDILMLYIEQATPVENYFE